jgi:hypothetical protein
MRRAVISCTPGNQLTMMFAGWINRHQRDLVDYLQDENRQLKDVWADAASASPTPTSAARAKSGVSPDLSAQPDRRQPP